jgi:hypothetical protein
VRSICWFWQRNRLWKPVILLPHPKEDEEYTLLKRTFAVVTLCLVGWFFGGIAWPQEAAPTPSRPPAQATVPGQPEFIQAADEVLNDMSKLLDLPIREPLKKSLRSKDEIRAYLIREDKEDKDDAQRYADQKSLEAFGLIPKGFPLDSFLLDVLTDQVAGLYDPKAKEFYIADWIPVDEQRDVMAHELTHALEDQSFHIDPWIKAARPNDDAELARDAVSEGSAMAAMVDYGLRDQNTSVRDLPDVSVFLRAGALSEMDKDPHLKNAPMVIRDELIFPYLAGTSFSQQFLKANAGWGDLKKLFDNPPVSTQQILHPKLYFEGVKPDVVSLPKWKDVAPANWKLLEENVLGEFGLDETLKQFVGHDRAARISPSWAGDRYAVFEDDKTKNTHLVFLLHLDNSDDAALLFGQYSDLLEHKYSDRAELFRRPNYFQFRTPDGGVFLRCLDSECLVVEGASRETYEHITRAIGWPAAPVPPARESEKSIATAVMISPALGAGSVAMLIR